MEGPGKHIASTEAYEAIDGDTIRVRLDGEPVRVRILGIDAPESGGFHEAEHWGAEAKSYAKRLLEGRTVHLFTDPAQGDFDQYERLLAYVLTEDGVNYSVQAVADGMAETSINRRNPLALADVLEKAERLAREHRRGMWADRE
jgi:micrococcal nuclease